MSKFYVACDLEECRRFWKERDREIDNTLLSHLAGSSPPFDSLINPADPRFLTPGDMPLKIQAFCRKTRQPVPRKPGPIIRCVLESLALQCRKTLHEIEDLTGRQVARLYLLNGSANALLNYFTANAVRRPLVVAPADTTAIGNVIVQALALGHLQSLEQAREIVRNSFKTETLLPYATAWDTAYDRLTHLCAS
jgi:sugar (pentulose or hexulose) kinase